MAIFNKDAQHKCFENERERFTYFGASVVSSSSEYWEAQCCRDHIDMLKHESLSKSLILIKSLTVTHLNYLLGEPVWGSSRLREGLDGSAYRHPDKKYNSVSYIFNSNSL